MEHETQFLDLAEELIPVENTKEEFSTAPTLRFPLVPTERSDLPQNLVGYLDLQTQLPSDEEFNRIMSRRKSAVGGSKKPVLLLDASLQQILTSVVVVGVTLASAWWHSLAAALSWILVSGCLYLIHKLYVDQKKASRYPLEKQTSRSMKNSWDPPC